MPKDKTYLTASHWGPGRARIADCRISDVAPHPDDPDPSPINSNIAGSLNGAARVLRPAIRKAWLDHGTESKHAERGRGPFVEVSWDVALDLVQTELTRVRQLHGNGSIFAGSYGWASAGRFHHAQSQLKRFLNTQGGFVRSEGNYSYNAALVLMPHIVGPYRSHVAQATRWKVIAGHSDLVVMFGGVSPRNSQVSDGGTSRHRVPSQLAACAQAGVRFINFSPLRTDAAETLGAEWLPPRPGSDSAVMMALAHTLLSENLHDMKFLHRYTVGFDKVAAYLTGQTDRVVKSAEWASEQSGIASDRIRALARDMATHRTMITVAAGLQRADFGEQPLWAAITLAAMLGQIGLPGGGYGIGYGVNANVGAVERPYRWATLPQGQNPIADFIPVAMTSEMLLNPDGSYDYNGERRTFPDIRLLWWAGGNPFHHHQDLNRLRRAFQTPETIIVNEINWTSTARHADIVLPVAAPQERTDFGAGKSDNALVPMPRIVPPAGDSRIEFDIYADLAKRLGASERHGDGLSAEGWTRKLWEETRETAARHGDALPDWDSFIAGDIVSLPDPSPDQVFLAAYRADPDAHPLPTPSGRIELFSEKIASFGYDDCPGQAIWLPPRALSHSNAPPLYLISGQPETRLHSQLDNGAYSKSHKINGREPVLIHPKDAGERGIRQNDIVEIFNERGRCLAGAVLTEDILQGCLFLWTGAWYDPDFDTQDHRDRHGNPNVLTHDLRSSRLSQGTAAHSAMVDLRRFDGPVPPVTVHEAPAFAGAGTKPQHDD